MWASRAPRNGCPSRTVRCREPWSHLRTLLNAKPSSVTQPKLPNALLPLRRDGSGGQVASECCLSRRSNAAKADPGQPSVIWEFFTLTTQFAFGEGCDWKMQETLASIEDSPFVQFGIEGGNHTRSKRACQATPRPEPRQENLPASRTMGRSILETILGPPPGTRDLLFVGRKSR